MAGNRRWDDLLHESTRLVADGPGVDTHFPSLERNLDQLEQLSRQLKARVSRYDSTGEETAATRLLAREGIDADRLTRDLRSFELKTTFEDVFPVEATSVEEYLQQVHEMTVLAAIQEAQHESHRSFDNFMFQMSQAAWKRQKQEFLQSLSRAPAIAPPSAAPGGTPGGGLITNRPYTDTPPARSSGPGALMLAPAAAPGAGQSVAEKKATAYAAAVHQLNASRDSRQELKAATLFKDAYLSAVGDDRRGRSVDMLRVWQLVQSILAEDGGRRGGSSRSLAAMVGGARSHLEAGHAQYLSDVIHTHPAQAALGGSPGRLHRVHAFLRVRLRGQGELDFDRGAAGKGPALDTTWQQIYFCMRSGFYEEAKAVARSSPMSKDFAPKLAEWVDQGGRVSDETAAKVAEDCEKMACEVGRQGRPGYDKRKMLLYAIVSGSKEAGERLLRDIPVLFSTIEDFMWFKLAMLREAEAPSSSGVGPAPSSLEELQAYLQQYPPSYYTKNGKEPLVYPYVLLLSLQFHSAVLHLYKDPATEDYRVDALHMAVVLGTQGALAVVPGPPSRPGGPPDTVAEVAALIRSYGGQYLQRGQADVALDYYVAAAVTAGGGAATEYSQARDRMLTSCLRELLHTPSGMNLLLGNWGVGQREGVLRRLISDDAAQRKLVLSAARDCLETAQYDEATELFKRAEAFASALEVVTRRLSESMSRGEPEGASRGASLSERGREILEAARAFGAGSSAQEREALARQEATFHHLTTLAAFLRLASQGRPAEAIRELASLPYLPFNDRSVDESLEALRGVARVVEDRLQDAVRLLPALLARLTDTDGSVRQLQTKLANFVAHTSERNWSQATINSIAGMSTGFGLTGR